MAQETTFQLDTSAASVILTEMAANTVKQSANAISGRAQSMVESLTDKKVSIVVNQAVGIVPRGRGRRSIATVVASGIGARHDTLLSALVKAKDAGRVN